MMPPLIEAVLQGWITLTACAAIWLLSTNKPYSRWGFIVGLLGQPGWLLATWVHGQFGMFVVSLFFTYAYVQGIWEFWIKPQRASRVRA
jgi:hypothetical protein